VLDTAKRIEARGAPRVSHQRWLKILGFEDEQTGHGFRDPASTIMDERSGAGSGAFERQLVHKSKKQSVLANSQAEYFISARHLTHC